MPNDQDTDLLIQDLHDRELKLRRLLAHCYGGAMLYCDDGELQDSVGLPFIDFLRDSPDTIRHKMRDRGLKKLRELERP